MAKVDLRKIKEQALKATEKQQHAKAAELYEQIAAAEPNDPDWHQRAGEAWRKVPDGTRAAAQMTLAAEGYAKGGFLLKAIAVCKVVLQIDAKHTATQVMLADLYARREGKAPAGKIAVVSQVDLARTASGGFQLVPKTPSSPSLPKVPRPIVPGPPATRNNEPPIPVSALPQVPPAPSPPPKPASRRPDVPIAIDQAPRQPSLVTSPVDVSEPELGLGVGAPLVDIDARPDAMLLPATAPLESLPLHAFLGGRKSAQFSLDALVPAAEQEPAAYEISLDDDEELVEELSMRDVLQEGLPPESPTVPSINRISDLMKDETDFSDVMSDDAPAPPAPSPPPLPKIPLFSSLAAEDFRALIDAVMVRDVEPQETIMKKGEAGASLFVIVRGQVEVTLGPRTLATLGEGAFFGELGLITNFPRSATVTALESTQLLEISRELILGILARSPEVLKTLLRFFRDRLLDRLLGESPLFASLPPEEARRLSERFLFLELEPRVRAVSEGERSPGLFLLLCGEVDVVRAGVALATLGPGDVFGEMSLLERKPATASIVTRTKCWALELQRADFQEIMLTYPALLEYVSGLAERRKSDGDERVEFL